MTLQFIKEIINYDSPFHGGGFNADRHYKLYSDNTLIGQYYVTGNSPAFSFGDRQFSIEIIKQVFKPTHYYIIDVSEKIQIAEFDIMPNRLNSWVGTLVYNQTAYKFENIKPDIRHNIFKKDSWGHHKFRFHNNTDEITYRLHVRIPTISTSELQHKPAEGEIDVNNNIDLFVVLSGFFLLERYLYNRDSNN